MLKYVPNTLTIIRFLLIPIILIGLFTENYITSLILIFITGLTDVADGCIARKYNLVSNFGKLMDPLADKLTLVSILTALVVLHIIPLWILLIVVLKEFTMVAGASFLYGKDVVVYSRWYGKFATFLFYVSIAASIITKALSLSGFWNSIVLGIYCIALIMTVIALILYIHDLSTYGIIDKSDLNKDVKDVSIKKKK